MPTRQRPREFKSMKEILDTYVPNYVEPKPHSEGALVPRLGAEEGAQLATDLLKDLEQELSGITLARGRRP